MSFIAIGPEQLKEIAEVKAYARANPVLLDQLMAFAQPAGDGPVMHYDDINKGLLHHPRYVHFPGNVRVAYSVEEQPAGFYAHISISVVGRAKKGMTPNPAMAAMIFEAFGFDFKYVSQQWLQEYEPGEYAVNFLVLLSEHMVGHA